MKSPKTLRLLNIISLIAAATLVGCSEENSPVGKWKYGQSEGWYPILMNGQRTLVSDKHAFINSSSLIVDCRGKAIKQGKYFAYMSNINSVMLYDKDTDQVINAYPPEYIFSVIGQQVNQTNNFRIDLSKYNSGQDTQAQCSN